jgi:hypothetical protein
MNEPHLEAQRWLRQAQADLAVVCTLHKERPILPPSANVCGKRIASCIKS